MGHLKKLAITRRNLVWSIGIASLLGSLGQSQDAQWVDGQDASLVLGQVNFTNSTSATSDKRMYQPGGVAVDPATGKIFVADTNNHRILRFASVESLSNGVAAEAVFGQADFDTNTNGKSISKLHFPRAVIVGNNSRLWVVDRNNSRVLRYDNAATKLNGASADGVLGQPNFTTNTTATSATKMFLPSAITINRSTGTLYVSDNNNNRVLRFKNAATLANGAAADGVLGRPDFTTRGAARTQSGMNSPSGLAFEGGRLWVADFEYHRVTRFDNAETITDGGNASVVLGQDNFTAFDFDASENRMKQPMGLAADGEGGLWVADHGNSRLLRFENAASKSSGASADGVLGQVDLGSGAWSTARNRLYLPFGLAVDHQGLVWVADTYSDRVLAFEKISPSSVPDLTSASDTGISDTDNLTADRTPTFTGTAQPGAQVTVRSSVNGALGDDVADGSGNWSVTSTLLNEGAHDITATLSAGPPSSALTITIDSTAPNPPTALALAATSDSGISQIDRITNDNTPEITGQAESGTIVTLRADGATVGQASVNSPWSILTTSLADGLRQLTAIAEDDAGNQSAASAALAVTIDTERPSLVVNQAVNQADPTDETSVNFTALFSEAVIGFEVADFQIGGTAVQAGIQIGLSGGATAYTITPTAIPDEGTVIIGAIAEGVATDAAGNANLASTSSDPEVMIDFYGNSRGTAGPLVINSGSATQRGWLTSADKDVFFFIVDEARQVLIESDGGINTVGELRSLSGGLLNDPNADDNRGLDENFSISRPLPAGTYYIEVSSQPNDPTGFYRLDLTLQSTVVFRPDTLIGKTGATLVGDDVFSPANQSVSLKSLKARPVRAIFGIGNDGDIDEDYAVLGSRGNGNFKVSYTNDLGNITAAVVTGTHQTGNMAPFAGLQLIQVKVSPNKKKIRKITRKRGRRAASYRKKRFTLQISGISEFDPNTRDSVFLKAGTK